MPAQGLHLITTTPKTGLCHKCRRVVLEGIADGMTYRADAIPLNLTGEVSARLEGRNCYRLIAGRLVYRDHHDIASDDRHGRPAVVATHSCAPIDPSHIDPSHITTFSALATEPVPEQPEQDQHSLFVITGANAGARLTAVTVDEPAPF